MVTTRPSAGRDGVARQGNERQGNERERPPRAAWLLTVGALFLLALLQALGGAEDDPSRSEPPATPPVSADPLAATAAAADGETARRHEAAPEVDVGVVFADLALPFGFELQLRVVDPYGLPVPDAEIYVAPPRCALGRWPSSTDARGELLLALRGRTPVLPLTLCVFANGTMEPLRTIELAVDRPRSLTVCARGRLADTSALERLIAQYEPAALRQLLRARGDRRERDERLRQAGRLRRDNAYDLPCGRSLMLFAELDCTACHSASQVQSYEPLQYAPDLAEVPGSGVLCADLPPQPPSPQQRQQRRRERHTAPYERMVERLAQVHEGRGLGVIEGQVLADGVPQVDVPVAWLGDEGDLRLCVRTNGGGRYQLALPAGMPCRIVAGSIAHGREERVVAAAPTERVRADFALRADLQLRGRAVDAARHPLADWRVEFDGDAHAAVAVTDALGEFAFGDPPMLGRLLLWPHDADLQLPVVHSEFVTPTAPATLQLERAGPSRARIRIRAALPKGHARRPVEIRLWQLDTGRAAQLRRSGWDENFELAGLAAGHYRIEVGAPQLGFTALGPFALDGQGLWDLGTVALPMPGEVRVTAVREEQSPLAAQHAVYRRTEHTDVAVVPVLVDDDVIALPPGDYVFVRGLGDDRRGVAFTVRSGERTELRLSR